MRTATGAVLASALLALGCSGTRPARPTASAPVVTRETVATPNARSALPSPSRAPAPTPAATRSAAPPTAATAAVFHVRVSRIGAQTRARMRYSWRRGCPVALADLRLMVLDHWGSDGRVHRGELVVHRDAVAAVTGAMRRLFALRFPIERMRLVDDYGGSDDRSMAANNTSAFNCRSVSGRPGVWSQHAYGRAVDINPLVNPYVSDGRADPPQGQRYADRSVRAPGMIRAGDAVVRAFAALGWGWGGYWRSGKDYQHFSSTGR